MADFTGRRANLIYFAVIALAVIGMCWNPSHLATAVTDDDYDVYRAYLAAHPPPPGHALVVPGQTDGGRVMLCAGLTKSDDDLLWELKRLEGRPFTLDRARLGVPALAAPPPRGAYELLQLTRVALAGGSVVGLLQATATDCDGPAACAPERRAVYTAAKNDGAWALRGPWCSEEKKPG